MKRRTFLRLGATALVMPVLPSLVSGCAPSKTVMEFLIEFAIQTASTIVATSLTDGGNHISQQDQEAATEINTNIAATGFTDLSRTQVYLNNPVLFYGVGHQNGFNTCAPFFTNSVCGALIEGPIIVGLALAARNWPAGLDVPVAQGLIPQLTVQESRPQFDVSSSAPSIYKTQAGYISVNYQAKPQEQTAIISVVAQRDNGGVLLGQDYTLHAA